MKKPKAEEKDGLVNQRGVDCPHFCPPTPQSELAKHLKDIAESESEEGVRFKIIETGGRTIKSMVQKSNPTATIGCEEEDCLQRRERKRRGLGRFGEGGDYRRCGVNYYVECQLYPDD